MKIWPFFKTNLCINAGNLKGFTFFLLPLYITCTVQWAYHGKRKCHPTLHLTVPWFSWMMVDELKLYKIVVNKWKVSLILPKKIIKQLSKFVNLNLYSWWITGKKLKTLNQLYFAKQDEQHIFLRPRAYLKSL